MDDITTRLRHGIVETEDYTATEDLMAEAANTITALRERVKVLEEALTRRFERAREQAAKVAEGCGPLVCVDWNGNKTGTENPSGHYIAYAIRAMQEDRT